MNTPRQSLDGLNPDAPQRMLDRLDQKCKDRNRRNLQRCMERMGMNDGMNNCNEDMCETTHYWSGMWNFLGKVLLWFIIITIFAWLIYYSLKPGFVKDPDTEELSTSRLLLASVLTGLCFIVIIWLLYCFCSGKFCGFYGSSMGMGMNDIGCDL
jgi:hypothetical protein